MSDIGSNRRERPSSGADRRAERLAAREGRSKDLVERQRDRADETAERRQQMRHVGLRRQAQDQVLLRSPSLAVFKITVDDKGNLSTEEVVPVELTQRDSGAAEAAQLKP